MKKGLKELEEISILIKETNYKDYTNEVSNNFYRVSLKLEKGVDGIIKIFKLKEVNINPHLIAMMITNNLTNKYSYTNGLTIDKILNETVSIPIFE